MGVDKDMDFINSRRPFWIFPMGVIIGVIVSGLFISKPSQIVPLHDREKETKFIQDALRWHWGATNVHTILECDICVSLNKRYVDICTGRNL